MSVARDYFRYKMGKNLEENQFLISPPKRIDLLQVVAAGKELSWRT